MAPLTPEQRKSDLVDKLIAEARTRVGDGEADSVDNFLRRYFALVAPDDIIYTSVDTLLGGAMSLWELGRQRKPGTAKVRIFNPAAENGWTLEHTVIEIVNDDMPFLVDSVSAEINRRERSIHLLLHPVVRVRRDTAGRRVEMTSTQAAPIDAIVESMMHIEIDQETSDAELEALRGAIERVLTEVRVAVADWRTMRDKLAQDVGELEEPKLEWMPREEVDEAREFLRWLDDGNFIFLGFRRYGFETRDGFDYLPAIPESGLGILREMRPESLARSQAPLSPEFSDYARHKDLIIVTKANSRSLVHRPVPLDRIGIKRYDERGNLVGEDRFLGLFTSAAYSRSVREIPMLRLKTDRAIRKAGLDPRSHNGKAFVDILETFPRAEFFQITDQQLFEVARGILLLQERHRVALFTRKDVFERFVSCYVFVPRDRYTPDFRERAKLILEEAFEGRDTQVYDHVTDAPLARGLFIVQTSPGNIPDVDVKRIEARLGEAARTWSDRLLEKLIHARGEEKGIELHHRYKKAFPMAYAERFSAGAALYDIDHVEEVLEKNNFVVDLYQHRGDGQFHCKIIHAGPPVALSEIMPQIGRAHV